MRSFSILVGLLLASLLSGCGGDDTVTADSAAPTAAVSDDPPFDEDTIDGESTADPADQDTSTDGSDGPTGTVAIQLETVEGIFMEGFEVGLRVESTEGATLASTLWSDHVESLGDPSPTASYDSVYEATVPAGDVVVLATVNVGIGPPPETPDITGKLDCRLKVSVPENGRAEVEIDFSGTNDCLHQIS